MFSFSEFFLISYLYPDQMLPFAISVSVSFIGFVMVLVGHAFRVAALFTAGSNFNHRIQFYKEDKHELVTTGVYSWSRHPSYFGWFMWSAGTQIMLLNPLSIILFIGTSWYFFRQRIDIEEELLIEFFK